MIRFQQKLRTAAVCSVCGALLFVLAFILKGGRVDENPGTFIAMLITFSVYAFIIFGIIGIPVSYLADVITNRKNLKFLVYFMAGALILQLTHLFTDYQTLQSSLFLSLLGGVTATAFYLCERLLLLRH
ncbi:hypothetical protein [Bacillus sp. SJS]|uniref:hypothetical protein n=1 Tax=Bacillus sp. SJS TaxID=1423321 RepID=UPI0004DD3A17|nr:hypothetical protein [Bacillus sp. SJS]KZZ84155.1 hypothetical protein AS29_013265 [Bacillus sp. SJS]